MVNPRLKSHKLVIPAMLYHRRTRIPKEWLDVIKDANFSILASGRTGCLHEDTEIMTAHGDVRIKDCPLLFQVYSFDFDGYDGGRPDLERNIQLKLAEKIYSEKKKVYELGLSNGKTVKCSEDHIFFADVNGKRAEVKLIDLKPGQKIMQLGDPATIEYIEPLGYAKTYDLKVADNHNFFLANGILAHNSGKDSITTFVVNLDQSLNRTVICLDTKMEYPCAIFCQNDVVLRNLLLKNRLVGMGYKTVLWIPFVEGMERNAHFRELITYHHPNLEIRPFRILIESFTSEDSYNMSLSKTHLQAMARKDMLVGQSKMLNEAREEMGRRMGFDDDNLHEDGCGWEYLDFEEITTNRKVNVISTFFMFKNTITATSYMIGLLNDFLSIGKSINRIRGPDELFTVVIPEVEIILPRGVKSLDQTVNTLKFSMRTGLKLMRSFGIRFRMNLQNLSALDPDMVSQSVPFAGRTWNPKDLNMLGIFGLSKKDRIMISRSRIGQFRDVIHGKDFSAIPFSHKAREMEYFVTMMRNYYRDPSLFLFETENYFLSEIIDYEPFFWEGKPLTVPEYNHRVKKWLAQKEPRSVYPIDYALGEEAEVADVLDKNIEELEARAAQ